MYKIKDDVERLQQYSILLGMLIDHGMNAYCRTYNLNCRLHLEDYRYSIFLNSVETEPSYRELTWEQFVKAVGKILKLKIFI